MVHHQYDDVWIVIPVYNEAPVVRGVIEHVLTVFPNVVCVDDGSSDGSIEEIAATRAHLVRHPVNLGQGASLETGLAYARSPSQARAESCRLAVVQTSSVSTDAASAST